MGFLNLATDITGQMSDTELNSQNISDIVDELNRNSDNLDSISQALNIIAYNKLTTIWNGTGGGSPTVVSDVITTGAASSFLAFYDRSDIPNQLFSVPNIHYDSSGNVTCIVTGNTFTPAANTGSIEFSVEFLNNGSPITFHFYYYILQQPTNTTNT